MSTSNSPKPTILITGAGGFVGQRLVESALEQGWSVWAGTRRKHLGSLSSHPNLQLIHLDYEHPDLLRHQITQHPRWQYVIHCAGLTRSIDPAAYSLVNTTYTINLAKALMETGQAPEKFIFMSSLEAVGPGDENPFRPISLDCRPCPVSAYGRSKLAAEEGLKAIEGLPWLILRPTGMYGPGDKDYLAMAKLIHKGLAPTMGLTPQQLSFLYIDDLVELCWLAVTSTVIHKTWLVAHPSIIRDDAFIALTQGLMGKRHLLKFRVPLLAARLLSLMGETLGRLSGSPFLLNKDKYLIMAARNWTCDISALQADLGYTPPTNLRTGWANTLHWYKQKGWL